MYRSVPVMFKRSRYCEFGLPLDRTAREIDRDRFWLIFWFRLSIFLALCGTGMILFNINDADPFYPAIGLALGFVFSLLALVLYCNDFIPGKWIITNENLIIRNAKDRHRIIPWHSVKRIETKFNSIRAGVVLHTDHGTEKIMFPRNNPNWTVSAELPRFLNRLCEKPPRITCDTESLAELRNRFLKEELTNTYIHRYLNFGLFVNLFGFVFIYIIILFSMPLLLKAFNDPRTMLAVLAGETALLIGLLIACDKGVYRKCKKDATAKLAELMNDDIRAEFVSRSARLKDFGEPPRLVKGCFFSMSMYAPVYILLLGFLFTALSLSLFHVYYGETAYLRAIVRPDAWEKAGNGTIITIWDANEVSRKNGFPYGDEGILIAFETELPGNLKHRCVEPFVIKDRLYRKGDVVPLLRYTSDEKCLRIDSPERARFYHERYLLTFRLIIGLIAAPILLSVFLLRKRSYLKKALAEFHVRKYIVRNTEKGNVKTLEPLETGQESITLPIICAEGTELTLFYDPNRPKKSLIAERFNPPLFYDPESGEISGDNNFSPTLKFLIVINALLMIGLSLLVLYHTRTF